MKKNISSSSSNSMLSLSVLSTKTTIIPTSTSRGTLGFDNDNNDDTMNNFHHIVMIAISCVVGAVCMKGYKYTELLYDNITKIPLQTITNNSSSHLCDTSCPLLVEHYQEHLKRSVQFQQQSEQQHYNTEHQQQFEEQQSEQQQNMARQGQGRPIINNKPTDKEMDQALHQLFSV